ncbi:hypothetical protein ACFSVJ_05185 [Prauserella oleivorans]
MLTIPTGSAGRGRWLIVGSPTGRGRGDRVGRSRRGPGACPHHATGPARRRARGRHPRREPRLPRGRAGLARRPPALVPGQHRAGTADPRGHGAARRRPVRRRQDHRVPPRRAAGAAGLGAPVVPPRRQAAVARCGPRGQGGRLPRPGPAARRRHRRVDRRRRRLLTRRRGVPHDRAPAAPARRPPQARARRRPPAGRGRETGFARQAADELGVPADGDYVVFVAELAADGTPGLAMPQDVLAGYGVRSVWQPRDQTTVGLVALEHRPLRAVLDVLRAGARARVGVSPAVPGLSEVGTGHDLALLALRTLPAGGSGFAVLDERLPEALVARSPELAGRLLDGVLGPLLRLPEAERDVLLPTLAAWLETNRSAAPPPRGCTATATPC